MRVNGVKWEGTGRMFPNMDAKRNVKRPFVCDILFLKFAFTFWRSS